MNIIVIGMGEVGKQTAFMLAMENHNIVIIDNDQKTLLSAEEKMDVMAFGGHGASPATLKNAMVDTADLLIAVTDNDEINLLASMLAKQLGAKHTICRVSNKDFLPNGRGYYPEYFGIDLVLSPNVLTAIEIVKIIKSTSALASQDFAENKIQFIKVLISDKSNFVNKTIYELKLPELVTVIAILRDEDVIFPSEDQMIEEGDYLLLLGGVKQIKKLERQFDIQKAFKNRRVMLVGAGEIALEVAEELERIDAQCVLIDADQERCEFYSDRLAKTDVVCGDATDITFLREENIQNVDVFVGLTSKDEVNLMTTLLAKREGVKKTIALTQNSEYSKIYEQLGVDVTISPRIIAASHILGFVGRGKVASNLILEEHKAELLEIAVHENSRVTGKEYSELNLPHGSFIPFVVKKKGDVIRPYPSMIFEESDRVLIVTVPKVKNSVERLFKRKGIIIS